MTFRSSVFSLALALAFASGLAIASPAPGPAPPRNGVAIFAMGCFWCGETQFEGQRGVLSVVSGYTGGKEQNPTYEQVSSHLTGHYESVKVTFDPAKTSYEKLLDVFWHSVDPTQDNGQFCDHGHQYLSVVFVQDDSQRRAAEASKAAIQKSGVLKKPIVTAILPAATFWPAEQYHQDFWKKDPERYRSYREGCGRDRRLRELWGAKAAVPLVH